jgi:TctA family transporter
MYLATSRGSIICFSPCPWFAAILRIPFSVIAALILVVCAIGAFTVHNATFDIVLMLVFGIVGYVLKKLDYPLAPLVLALVLGDRAEESFRQSLLLSQGSFAIFWSNPLVSTIMAAGLALLLWPALTWALSLRGARRTPRPAS